MKKQLFLSVLITISVIIQSEGQTYLISNGGSEVTCSGNLYDSGGSGSNYGNNENDTITICATSGYRLRMQIVSMSIAAGDFLYVFNGSEAIGTPWLTNPGPATYNTLVCNCLTFVFVSNGSGTSSGFNIAFACYVPAAVSNDYSYYASSLPLDGSCLVGQTNVGSTSDYTSGCFTGGYTVYYDVTPSPGNNTIDVTMQNATFADGNVQYLLIANPCGQYAPVSAQCGPANGVYQWTNLQADQYILGVSTSAVNVGTFDICVTESWIDHCGDYVCGSTEDCAGCSQDCGACPEAVGGPYFHPIIGQAGFNIGKMHGQYLHWELL